MYLLQSIRNHDGLDEGCWKKGNQGDSCELLLIEGSRLVSQHTTTPLSYIHPTMVVPVLVALGKGAPLACRAALRL